ncbi:MAG: calcium/sodium antiporter [Planctomycetes bacterium]|nr:calcium/sodium antiporter [Planctomycetota bacterium]
MEYVLIAVQLAFGVLGLHYGANWLVSGSSKLALTFGIKPLIIGLTVVAMGTSAPELTVSLGGAFQGKADLAVGNVVGSNIANIGLILGLSALIRPMKIQIEPLKRDLPFMLFAALLLAVLPFIGGPVETENGVAFMMGRWKGGVLLGAMALFMWLTFRNARGGGEGELTEKPKGRGLFVLLTLVGLGVLLIGGKLFVDGAVSSAKSLGIPELVIGLTVVAVGTSLPELATSLIATIKGESDISLGNVVGSNIFNVCMVLGLVAVIQPLAIDVRVMQLDMIVMLFLSLWVTSMAWRGKDLSRLEGISLLGAYVLYVVNLFFGWV